MNSNGTTDNITLNSCQYTPVYLIQNNSLTQTGSYVLAPNVQDEQRPVSSNLKLFYENSGNLENGLLLNNVQFVASPPAPKQLQIQEPNTAAVPNGNNLKLASFLVPNNKDAANKQYIATISNKILKPTVSCSNTNVLPNLVSTNVNGGVRSKPNQPRTLLRPRILPKIQPKEKIPEKHSAVHLLKLGGAYHSLNQLNEEQMRLVNQALEKIGADPEKTKLKPTYDPVTNTRIVYKVISPNDLKLVGKNKIIVKATAIKREIIKREEIIKKEEITKKEEIQIKKEELKKEKVQESEEDDDQDAVEATEATVKVTRSGRAVKLPRHRAAAAPPPPRARRARAHLPCHECKHEFPTVYRLQRHYDKHPAHRPAPGDTPLFTCLVSGVRGAARGARGAELLARLRELLASLRALLPCLLRGGEGDTYVEEDVARLFGISAGTYSINVDALTCVKDEEGFCKHNPKPTPPPQPQFTADLNKPSQIWLSKHQEETATEVEDCARIHPVDKWPIKNTWKHKLDETEPQTETKRVKLTSETVEPLIELGSETIENIIGETVDNAQPPLTFVVEAPEEPEKDKEPTNESTVTKLIDTKRAKGSHSQFYSTHFDIRSSPIKPSSAVFCKFQIVPEKIPDKFDSPLLRPLSFMTNESDHSESIQNTDNSLDLNIFKELSSGTHDPVMTSNDLSSGSGKGGDELDRLALATAKEWALPTPTHGETECLKPLIEPSMIHVQDTAVNTTNYDNSSFSSGSNFNDNPINNNDNSSNDNLINESRISLNQSSSSVLNFLDTFEEVANDLSCQDNELRNTSMDFQLDLFSFHNSC